MKRLGALLCFLSLCCGGSPSATAQEQPAASLPRSLRVLVQRLEPVGVSKDLARTLEEAVILDLGQRQGVTAVSPAELEQTVEFAQEQAELGCDALDACMVEVQKKLQVEKMITGKVSQLGSDLFLTLGLVDLAKQAVGKRVSRQAVDLAALRAQIGSAIDEVLGKKVQRPAFRLQAGESLKLAVMPLSARGVPEATADAMTQILSAELNGIDQVSVISRDDIGAMLDKVQVEGELGCTANMECIVEIGAALGLSKLVTGTVGKVKNAYVIGAQLIDIRGAEVVSRVLESFEGDAEELKHAVKLAAYQIVGVDYERHPGRLALTFNVDEADVRIGDRRIALRGHDLDVEGLTPGRYSLRVVPDPDDYYPLQTDIYVAPNAANVRTFNVEATPADWYESWWFWTAAGVVIAGATVTTVLLLDQQSPTTGTGTVTVGALTRSGP